MMGWKRRRHCGLAMLSSPSLPFVISLVWGCGVCLTYLRRGVRGWRCEWGVGWGVGWRRTDWQLRVPLRLCGSSAINLKPQTSLQTIRHRTLLSCNVETGVVVLHYQTTPQGGVLVFKLFFQQSNLDWCVFVTHK